MKKFISKINSHIFTLIIFFIIVYIFVLIFDKTPSSPTLKINKFFNKFENKSLCFYGDSKSLWNFNYSLLKEEYGNIYNFALAGSSLSDNLNFYGKDIFNCDISVINLYELTSFSNDIIKNKLYYSLNSRIFFNPLNFKNIRTNFSRIKYNYKKSSIKKGFFNLDGATSFNIINSFENNSKEKIEEVTNRINIAANQKKIIFIIHPDTKQNELNLNRYYGINYINKIHDDYLSKYDLIDFRKYENLKNESLYFDGIHLNQKGSRTFTKIFIEELKQKITDF